VLDVVVALVIDVTWQFGVERGPLAPGASWQRLHRGVRSSTSRLLAGGRAPGRHRRENLRGSGYQRIEVECADPDQVLETVDDLDISRLPTAHHRHELGRVVTVS
jgi:hypothetical protein